MVDVPLHSLGNLKAKDNGDGSFTLYVAGIDLNAGDIQIGAVEIKDADTAARMNLAGGLAANAVRVVLASDVSLPAGSNELGRTNVRHFNVAATQLTRPGNVTPYSAGDSVSDNATAGSVTALPVTVSDTNDDPVNITQILLDTTDTGFAGVPVRVHVFNSDPTAGSGVGAGDNAARSQKKAGWLGSLSGTFVGFSDGAKAVLSPDNVAVLLGNVETSGKRLWWQLETLGAATPSANSTTFTPRFKGYQGRA